MTLGEVLKGLQLNNWVLVAVIDAETDKYLKGGYVKDVINRYSDLTVIRTVVSREGVLRFWVEK